MEAAIVAEAERRPVGVVNGIVVIITFERSDVRRRWRGTEDLRRILITLAKADHLAVHKALVFFPVDLTPKLVAALHINDRALGHDDLNRVLDSGAPAQIDIGGQNQRCCARGSGGEKKCGGGKRSALREHSGSFQRRRNCANQQTPNLVIQFREYP